MSSNLMVSGLQIQNSPQFHMKFDGCQGVLIDRLTISAPKLSPNTDGIHVENSQAVGIYNSMISNGIYGYSPINVYLPCLVISFYINFTISIIIIGDDCISIGPGTSDVDIAGVTCGPSHGIRLLHFIIFSYFSHLIKINAISSKQHVFASS